MGRPDRYEDAFAHAVLPAGAESSGLHAVNEINGWTYLMSNFQHAGDCELPPHDKVKAMLDPLVGTHYKDRFRRERRLPDH